ncbi:histidine kinase [Sulfurifustis variabilis]|uniref:histidine kinase n=1 Tax=Sulfurifustis variabilis TaxID=1675686 RepID=A0A1B4V614_9GAMM|nr:ATP-binding protein [Sulfurifustis variabilis]BAU48895.1 histidine kinase [Sulfurifustis variabilis]
MLTAWRERIRSGLRYKLLALVVLPLLLTMVATLGYALYWFNAFTLDLLRDNARDNLALARSALRESEQEYQSRLAQLAASAEFRRALARSDSGTIRRLLERLRQESGFSFLHLTGITGEWLHEDTRVPVTSKPSPLTDRAARGLAGAALELFRFDDLMREDPLLPDRASIHGEGGIEVRALMLRIVRPVSDASGKVTAILDGAVLLNHNQDLVELVRERVFRVERMGASESIAAILIDGVRAAASAGGGKVGERARPEQRRRVLEGGETWAGLERLDGRLYISAYAPLFDVNAQRVGMLHVGFPERVFRERHYWMVAWLLGIFLAATVLAAWIAFRGARSVFRPIEEMTAVVRANQAGEERRIGAIGRQDEIGELARQFDVMLDQLARRNQELRQAAETLEAKVDERTAELAQKNADLERTIRLLEQTREQLVVAEKLSALGVLAAGIAHEINNPAAVILGNLELLVSELGEAARPVAPEIELIEQQVERIRRIVTGLLQFARPAPEPGVTTEVDVNRAVEEVLPLVSHAFRKKAVVLRTRFGASRPVRINLYEIEQVLVNLLLNAVNAVPEGGIVHVETTDWERRGVVLRVRDNGEGIPPDRLTRLFDPFYTTDPRRGTGLGLWVSYALVRRYGGNITVKSKVGRGSVFNVWLLCVPQAAADAWPAVALERLGANGQEENRERENVAG